MEWTHSRFERKKKRTSPGRTCSSSPNSYAINNSNKSKTA